ncbi:methyl-accepting chemotaxis protein [Pseudoalteromonas sp. S1727]|uniref:methyl-accepting chemotaxis protein n=1 Tax=Pseudoalteromonas sp. S1727 TaxID=2066514 RepID=UPI0011086896|nr:methyl-accepting chemotaxis protein [Pseudoalteromonas sp. S1727]TMN71515.1 methyl-accepting chemotaxis protein [Pseudoalteromonas sp. S1727]
MIRNIRIGFRTLLAFGISAFITLAIGVFSIIQLSNLNTTTDVLTLHRIPAILTVADLRRDVLLTQVVINELSDAKSVEQLERLKKMITDLITSYDESEKRMSMLSKSKESIRIYNEVKRLHDDLIHTLPILYSHLKIGEMDRFISYREQAVVPIARELRRALNDFSDFQSMRASQNNDDATKTYELSNQLVVTSTITGLIVAIFLASLYSKSLIVPLRRSVDIAKKIANGDLSQDFSDNHKDEAAEMLSALSLMQNQLRDALSRIADSSHQLASTSEELSAVTNQSSQVVVQQNDQIGLAATAVSQLTAAIEEVAKTASATSSSSSIVSDKTQEGKIRVTETIQIIELLKSDIQSSETSVIELSEKIKNITSVLDVIRAIADQTNLLALNAAIEAARAGENGRGFAVVADEVRALAHRTQESTKDIESMISSVSIETQKTVDSMSKSNQLATSTLAVANDTGKAFEEILMLVIEINSQSATIASAAEEQATVAKEVDNNLLQIRDLSLQTSVGTDQTTASSAELARLAEHLNELVLKFKF